MPLFALGKTQELLVMLNDFRRRGQIPNCPIYIGGLGAKLPKRTIAWRTRLPGCGRRCNTGYYGAIRPGGARGA